MKKRKKSNFIKEEYCLNCQTALQGKFCQECGQKAFLHKENFFYLVYEFVADYFHFDGKFFKTLKKLFTQPGAITKEYMMGKRKTYLNPIQMYIFVSAIFFIVFSNITISLTHADATLTPELMIANYYKAKAQRDSISKHTPYSSEIDFSLSDLGFTVNGCVFTTAQYDSIENSLPKNKRENWLYKKIHKRMLLVNDRTVDPHIIADEEYPKALLKSLPKAFFILLPVFALILWLFYRKTPYVDHIIFSLHYHIIGFIFLLFFFSLVYFEIIMDVEKYVFIAVMIGLFAYLLASAKRVFQQSFFITLIKTIGISLLYGTIFIFTMLLVMVFTLLLV